MDPESLPDIDVLLRERVAHLRHMAALDRWLAEYQAEHGAFTEEEMEETRRIFDESDARLAAKMAAAETRTRDDAAAR
ncbi:MAG TPA: hypothetical protein VGO60_10550 [Iamia sp.]|jgi:hypothetical protein|nr:hypothetical protein [Iamia sp.]